MDRRRTTIFFDFGGTLARLVPPNQDPVGVWVTSASKIGLDVPSDRVAMALQETTRRLGPQIYEYVGRTDEYWRLFDGMILDRLGVKNGREKLLRRVRRTFHDPANVELFPETRSVLEVVRARGYLTGLISNHDDGLLELLEFHRLKPLFDSVTYSQEAGAEKPNPAIFSKALQRAGASPSEAVHVGDSIAHDVEGAIRSGIEPIWVDRMRLGGLGGYRTIHSLDELIGLLGG
ncbi:MAG TPA: HAD-IA family hydrolase [Thermoplasmata archaeon]|nr:HAD-IA family hydrolase [Thermoplasmata archaeon]